MGGVALTALGGLWAGSGGAAGSRGRRRVSRGRCGTWRHLSSLCVASVALGDSHLHFAWQAWHLRHWAGSGGAAGSHGRRGLSRGRRGTWRHSFCVAGVALGDIHLHFAWQAWHLPGLPGGALFDFFISLPLLPSCPLTLVPFCSRECLAVRAVAVRQCQCSLVQDLTFKLFYVACLLIIVSLMLCMVKLPCNRQRCQAFAGARR